MNKMMSYDSFMFPMWEERETPINLQIELMPSHLPRRSIAVIQVNGPGQMT